MDQARGIHSPTRIAFELDPGTLATGFALLGVVGHAPA